MIYLLFTAFFQNDTEIRVFEDEETGENERIIEISTGPKGNGIVILQD